MSKHYQKFLPSHANPFSLASPILELEDHRVRQETMFSLTLPLMDPRGFRDFVRDVEVSKVTEFKRPHRRGRRGCREVTIPQKLVNTFHLTPYYSIKFLNVSML